GSIPVASTISQKALFGLRSGEGFLLLDLFSSDDDWNRAE
ncbi:MAG: hypothetical protein ACI9AF_001042, partial [Granulosicoccus sp.]